MHSLIITYVPLTARFAWVMSTFDEADETDELKEANGAGSENGEKWEKTRSACRYVTLQNLLGAGVLEPGEGAMTIDYLGQKFTGDLLLDGKIKSQETEKIYTSPTAWAVSCKKVVNPVKQSGCGWATVRYKGTKLDAFKNIWIQNHYDDGSFAYDFMAAFENNIMPDEVNEQPEATIKQEPSSPESDEYLPHPPERPVVKHSSLGNRNPSHDVNTLVETVTFESLGKIQPFQICLRSNAALTIDFHCHLTQSEVVGYLAGTWDANSHVITVSHAFPVRCRLGDFEEAPNVQMETRETIRNYGLTLLGWYHSHPQDTPEPTLKDIDAQLEYEMKMKGSSESSYLPCVGLICSPYNVNYSSMESQMAFYWVAPPPESRVYEYGKPMSMNYLLHLDESIPHEVLMEMKKCADFYRRDGDYVIHTDLYKGKTTYLEKCRISFKRKFPRNMRDSDDLWNCLFCMMTSEEEPDTALLKDMLAISNTPCLSPELDEPEPVSSPSSSSPSPSPSPSPPPKRRRTSESKPSLNDVLPGSEWLNALLAASMTMDPAMSLLNWHTLGLGMLMPSMLAFNSDPESSSMLPPSNHFSFFNSSKESPSRSSSSSPSSNHRDSPSSTSVKDTPSPNKVPKLENDFSSTNHTSSSEST